MKQNKPLRAPWFGAPGYENIGFHREICNNTAFKGIRAGSLRLIGFYRDVCSKTAL